MGNLQPILVSDLKYPVLTCVPSVGSPKFIKKRYAVRQVEY